MTTNKLAIIGGSGLYDVEEFKDRETLDLNTPWGKPSDLILKAKYNNKEIYFLPRHGKEHIRSIQDYPKKGILFRDITTLIKNEKAFKECINQIADRSKKFQFDKIAAIESRGFVFASAVSYILNKPFILLRKKNKLPAEVYSVDFELEYGAATIEVHKDSFMENDKVLIIDDLIATGGTAEAAAKLIEISKSKVAGFIFVINLFDLGGTDNLLKKGYKVENLVDFPGH